MKTFCSHLEKNSLENWELYHRFHKYMKVLYSSQIECPFKQIAFSCANPIALSSSIVLTFVFRFRQRSSDRFHTTSAANLLAAPELVVVARLAVAVLRAARRKQLKVLVTRTFVGIRHSGAAHRFHCWRSRRRLVPCRNCIHAAGCSGWRRCCRRWRRRWSLCRQQRNRLNGCLSR